MTTSEYTPARVSVLLELHKAHPIPVVPIVAAQRAGDADYDWCIQRGLGGEAAAVAYHLAYQYIARQPGGCGPVCDCDHCREEFSRVE